MSENRRPRGRRKNVTGTGTGAEIHGEGLGTGPVGEGGMADAEQKQDEAQQQGQGQDKGSLLGSLLGGSGSGSSGSGGGNLLGSLLGGSGSNKPGSSKPGSGSLLGGLLGGSGSGSSGSGSKPGSGLLGSLLGGGGSGGNGGSGQSSGGQGGQGGGLNLKKLLPIILIVIVLIVVLTQCRKNDNANVADLSGNGGTSTSGSSSGGFLSSLLGGSWFGGQTGQATAAASGGRQTNYTAVKATDSSIRRFVDVSKAKKATIMIYMCGTDLESRSAMATRDIQEMLAADFGSNVRVLLYTGGCNKWQNNLIGNNQVWEIKKGKVVQLEDNLAWGSKAMTDPNNLKGFIQYCKQQATADRYALILWDHGGGSVTGYGYDEKVKSNSMSLSGINSALKAAGVKFDFIGFDACLMATVETALMCGSYADYLIASEETEPGIGWYYTDWLTALGKNPAMPTVELGKQICDDFIKMCDQQCRGQKTTLSVIDLGELKKTVPAEFTAFSKSITGLIKDTDNGYAKVSAARNGTREFAASSRIDQVDLVDLALRMDNDAGKSLANVLQSAVKYNRVNGMTDAYGISVYFPYQKAGNVTKATNNYTQIEQNDDATDLGLDSYSECIRAFAQMENGAQYAATGGSYQAYPSAALSGGSSGGGFDIGSLLEAFMSSGRSIPDSGVSNDKVKEFVSLYQLDRSKLVFTDGVMDLGDQWVLVNSVDRNLFIDNGEGYIDLGLDNVYDWTGDNKLAADADRTALALGNQFMPYYHLSDEDGAIYGMAPALLTKAGETEAQRVRLLITFTPAVNDKGEEYDKPEIVGYEYVYKDAEKAGDAVLAKPVSDMPAMTAIDPDFGGTDAVTTLSEGDTIRFIADFYNYKNEYQDSYEFGSPVVWHEGMEISDKKFTNEKLVITYRITDIYNNAYWTAPVR